MKLCKKNNGKNITSSFKTLSIIPDSPAVQKTQFRQKEGLLFQRILLYDEASRSGKNKDSQYHGREAEIKFYAIT